MARLGIARIVRDATGGASRLHKNLAPATPVLLGQPRQRSFRSTQTLRLQQTSRTRQPLRDRSKSFESQSLSQSPSRLETDPAFVPIGRNHSDLPRRPTSTTPARPDRETSRPLRPSGVGARGPEKTRWPRRRRCASCREPTSTPRHRLVTATLSAAACLTTLRPLPAPSPSSALALVLMSRSLHSSSSSNNNNCSSQPMPSPRCPRFLGPQIR